MKLLSAEKKNNVLQSVIRILDESRETLLAANKKDIDAFTSTDKAMYDRLIINDKKIDEMIKAVKTVQAKPDPIGRTRTEFAHPNGMKVYNRTAPFGTILIIYESRPDVTVEAAVVAFKSNNKILLKGGKEAVHSNQALVDCWHKALEEQELSTDWVQLLHLKREETQAYLKQPDQPIDLIVPRGGEGLIRFVKTHASCPVLVSGRGNNFLYVHKDADWEKSLRVILNAKTHKISACNALDKILIHEALPAYASRVKALHEALKEADVEVLVDTQTQKVLQEATAIKEKAIWGEEFLALKACIGTVNDLDTAIDTMNTYSGGHSCAIMTENTQTAETFMEQVDAAAVYHNASTRFTDGGQMGTGAELAISTDKLHHRGPLGLDQLVTNKWFVFGDGQTRN